MPRTPWFAGGSRQIVAGMPAIHRWNSEYGLRAHRLLPNVTEQNHGLKLFVVDTQLIVVFGVAAIGGVEEE